MIATDTHEDTDFADVERRLRTACAATIPRLLDVEHPNIAAGPGEIVHNLASTGGSGRRGLWAIAAASILVVGTIGLIAQRPNTNSVPPAAADSSSIPARFDPGDHFDQLAVQPGATDFYVASDQYGQPTLHLDLFQSLTRCAELSADGLSCARIEGIAGLSLADYRPPSGGSIQVGTTFATVTPDEYARAWGPTEGDGLITSVEVRGHSGVRYMNETRPALVWAERDGVLVWISVSGDLEPQLLEIADSLTTTTGPQTIPHRVVVPGLGSPWDTRDNNGDGLVVAVANGVECVGYGSVDHCGPSVADRISTHTTDDGGVLVAGSAPADVLTVNVTDASGTLSANTIGFPPYESRFFTVNVPSGRPLRIQWIDEAGSVVYQGAIPAQDPSDTGPSASPPDTATPSTPPAHDFSSPPGYTVVATATTAFGTVRAATSADGQTTCTLITFSDPQYVAAIGEHEQPGHVQSHCRDSNLVATGELFDIYTSSSGDPSPVVVGYVDTTIDFVATIGDITAAPDVNGLWWAAIPDNVDSIEISSTIGTSRMRIDPVITPTTTVAATLDIA